MIEHEESSLWLLKVPGAPLSISGTLRYERYLEQQGLPQATIGNQGYHTREGVPQATIGEEGTTPERGYLRLLVVPQDARGTSVNKE